MKNYLKLAHNKDFPLYLAWITALIGTIVSYYFSNVLGFQPCVLCWYQRIAMYPLVIIIAIGIAKKDRNMPLYALPLAIVGFVISLYQNLLYFDIVPEKVSACTFGVSCTTKYIHWFGFVSIPLLSLIAFVIITFSLLAAWKGYKNA